jgi:hypothetical protein
MFRKYVLLEHPSRAASRPPQDEDGVVIGRLGMRWE